jgi:Flp pilus assembly protein TadD
MIDHTSSIERLKKAIMDRHFDAAAEHLRKTASLDPGRAEAFKLLGVIMEVRGDRGEAQKNYRAAFSVDPSHKPVILNLQRSSSGRRSRTGGVQFGDDRKAKPVDK